MIGLPELIVLFVIFFVIGIPAIVGAYIAGSKGRNKIIWFFICVVCPFCIILIIVLPPVKEIEGKYKQCPACKEFVKWEASVCKHCHKDILK